MITRTAIASALLFSSVAIAQPGTSAPAKTGTPAQSAPKGDAPPTPPTPPAAAKNPAVEPAERTDDHCKQRHAAFNERAKQGAEKGDIGVIFLGDSITEGWEGAGKDVWKKHYTKYNAMNLGIGGDRTQHVLWRLQHGNVDGLAKPKAGSAPKVVVMMIGTNNGDNTAEQVADGIKADIGELRARLPETKVLVLGIFPRGEKPNAQRAKNSQTNEIIAKAADGKMVHYLDIGPSFLEKDGTISKEIMPDYLHLSEEGYKRWAEAIEPTLKELLGEK